MLNTTKRPTKLAVLTSGGDAAGMNPAVRAVVRTALDEGLEVFGVYEGFRGLVNGGELIRTLSTRDVGGILYRGGTELGTARCQEFRERDGRRRAARNLVEHGVDALVVIGGDGSLTGANLFRDEWPDLLRELADAGEIDRTLAESHPRLALVGLVGSIDNDMFGTDMTIGADTALHRITEAIDAIQSTASSHQRSFVIEVMGRNCGYLALMSALATGANFVFIPENPPNADEWQDAMCRTLEDGRAIGRRANIVIVAEGARDRAGNPITATQVKAAIDERLGEDTRVTSLGHVQRGGSPSAFDRYLSTVLGYAAVQHVLSYPDGEPQLIGIRGHQIINSPLMECVAKTRSVAEVIASQDYDTAMEMRGGSFRESFAMLRTMVRARPHAPDPEQRQLRLGVMHCGGPAPGMNTAIRAAVRVGLDHGHTVLGIRRGFRGFVRGDVEELDWMSVSGWVSRGGAELGTSRFVPSGAELDDLVTQIETHRIDGLLLIGGWSAQRAAFEIEQAAGDRPALSLPMVCLPATINNDLPGTELTIGADTALNCIMRDVDRIKQSAVASRRSFIVEVMGRDCGYLALMAGLGTGAERVYLPEEGISLADLQVDLEELKAGFEHGKRVGLVIRNERADAIYTTEFIKALFEREGEGLFDVRGAILGHVQQGGDPSPFDRIQSTRLAFEAMKNLIGNVLVGESANQSVGLERGRVRFTPSAEFPTRTHAAAHRPLQQGWMSLRPIAKVMAKPRPS